MAAAAKRKLEDEDAMSKQETEATQSKHKDAKEPSVLAGAQETSENHWDSDTGEVSIARRHAQVRGGWCYWRSVEGVSTCVCGV
jgi:hypothetical protein